MRCQSFEIEAYCTVEPHCNGSQGTNNFCLLLLGFCYCQHMNEKTWEQEIASNIGGISLLAGLV